MNRNSIKIKSVRDLESFEFSGKKVLVRVDYNCPLSDGNISDDTRITATIPTLDFLLKRKALPILISHLGRPKGNPVPEMSLEPIANRLRTIALKEWGANVFFASDCIGEEAMKTVHEAEHSGNSIVLLENLRFHKAETENSPEFAKKLASLATIFVQDAFGTVHRAHASCEAITRELPSYAGLLVEKELTYLGELMQNPAKPFVAIIGGAKVSSKIEIIESLIKKVDTLLIGGGMTYTFLRTKDIPIGSSIFEKEYLTQAFAILGKAQESNTRFLLPLDHVATDEVSDKGKAKTVALNGIPDNWFGVDIGPKTISLFEKEIKQAGTIFWNGPLGVFEIDKFAKGSEAIAKAIAKSKAKSIIGGGDVISAIHKFGLEKQITHISTGGGASMEFLSGKKLPGVLPLLREE
jgi:phosphoglycerate kinase